MMNINGLEKILSDPSPLSRYRKLMAIFAIVFGCLFDAGVAIAKDVVTVNNTNSNPVPVVSVGRTSYQLAYELTAPSGSGEDCALIPVPAGMTLNITSIGVETTVDAAELPDVYLLLVTATGSATSFFRFRSALNLVAERSGIKSYRGIYELSAFAGNTNGNVSYQARICLGPPAAVGATLVSSARGVVSGFLETTTIFDGNSLQ